LPHLLDDHSPENTQLEHSTEKHGKNLQRIKSNLFLCQYSAQTVFSVVENDFLHLMLKNRSYASAVKVQLIPQRQSISYKLQKMSGP